MIFAILVCSVLTHQCNVTNGAKTVEECLMKVNTENATLLKSKEPSAKRSQAYCLGAPHTTPQ